MRGTCWAVRARALSVSAIVAAARRSSAELPSRPSRCPLCAQRRAAPAQCTPQTAATARLRHRVVAYSTSMTQLAQQASTTASADAAHPLRRRWEALATRVPGARTLRVLQWNTLADGLAQHGDFTSDPRCLEWAARQPLLLAELDQAAADVICLQEVNRFDDFFRPALRARGFEGVFHGKRSSPCEGLGFPRDGCAVFWRAARFELLGAPDAACFAAADGAPLSQGRLMLRLRERASGDELLVATTHLKAKGGAECEAVRALEAEQLMRDVAAAAAAQPHPSAVVVTGDMNDGPDSRAVATLAGHASLPLRDAMGGMRLPESWTTWKFRRSGGEGGEAVVTEKRAIIDFVYASSALRPVARWATPTAAEVGDGGLPCCSYGSDHLALLTDLEWGGGGGGGGE